ncbi:nucleotidyltransferase domain-containing protein [Oceanobacillus luteolus]|uniref:Nucleotidyltransferase domain-containing protein n=1 Tax=Oceanobacillus luteolus TaxID=1274358 RepID=A0ABW4HWA7_9BACI
MHVAAKGLESYTVHELSYIVMDYITHRLDYVDDDFDIIRMAVIGSRVKETHRHNSDVDIAFTYEGKYRSDSMNDVLNMNPLFINGIRVDFIPFSVNKGEVFDNNEKHQDLPIISLE